MTSVFGELHRAARKGNVEELKRLLIPRPDLIDTPDKNSWTFMHVAACNGRAVIVETLVQLGSQTIDTFTSYGSTPMHLAAWNGHVSVVETLVRLGSQTIDALDKSGKTPMKVAVRNGHVSLVEALVRLGSKAINIYTFLNIPDKKNSVELALYYLGAKSYCDDYDEDAALETRYRVFFQQSLLQRCFDHPSQRNSSSRRIR